MPNQPHDPTTDLDVEDVDVLYDAFRPRLVAARRSYIRKRLALVLVMPLIFAVGVAFASSSEDGVSQVASADERAEEDPRTERIEREPKETETAIDTERSADKDTEGSDKPEEDEPKLTFQWVEIESVGVLQVAQTETGVELGSKILREGWTAEASGVGGANALVLVLSNEESKLVATISFTDGVATVRVDDVTPEPEPEVETRKEIHVGDVGTVVVERDGEKLFLAVTWNHKWWEPVVVKQKGERVNAYFTNDGVKVHVEAWIEGPEIAHGTWRTEPEPKEEPTPKPKEEPEIQTRKEIHVGDVGKVVVEREGETLWLGVLWTHDFFDAVIVSSSGAEVHAYFTNDGFEHHVRAWIKGAKIKHEKWVVEPEIAPYDGTVSCGFGNVGILVEGFISRIMSVQEVEGVEWIIDIEVGEHVKIRFFTETEAWVMEAWGNGEAVVAECGQIE